MEGSEVQRGSWNHPEDWMALGAWDSLLAPNVIFKGSPLQSRSCGVLFLSTAEGLGNQLEGRVAEDEGK